MRSWTRELRLWMRQAKRDQLPEAGAWKEIACAHHAARRAWERFGLSLRPRDVYLIASRIEAGVGERISKVRDGEIYRVSFRGHDLFVVFVPERAIVVTVLTRAMAHGRGRSRGARC